MSKLQETVESSFQPIEDKSLNEQHMDYKELYEKARENAKLLLKANPSDEGIKNFISDTFPELIYQDDDKVRGFIMNTLFKGLDNADGAERAQFKYAIKWFENNGKQKESLRQEILQNLGLDEDSYEYDKAWINDLLSANKCYQMSMNEDMTKCAIENAISGLKKLYLWDLLRNYILHCDDHTSDMVVTERAVSMIQWKGDNLKEVCDFTGLYKEGFEKWFNNSWEEYEEYVHEHNNIFKLFNADGSHYEVPVGAWIVKTPDGYNVASQAIYRAKNDIWEKYDQDTLVWLCRIIHNANLSLDEQSKLSTWIDKWINHAPNDIIWTEDNLHLLNRIWQVLGQAADEHAFMSKNRIIGDKECVELQKLINTIKNAALKNKNAKHGKNNCPKFLV